MSALALPARRLLVPAPWIWVPKPLVMAAQRLRYPGSQARLAMKKGAHSPRRLKVARMASADATVAARTWTDHASSGSVLTTYLFSSLSLGPASADRYMAVLIHGGTASARTISVVTIGGAACSQQAFVQNAGTNKHHEAIWVTDSPLTTGTSGDVVVTFSSGMSRAAVSLYALTGISGPTPHAVGSDPGTHANGTRTTSTFDVPANGIVLAGAMGTTATATAWTNATQDSDPGVFETVYHRTASEAFESAQTGMTVAATNAWHLLAASWGP